MARCKWTATEAADKKRILVVDDHPMMREGLRGVIDREPDLCICGEAASAAQAMEAVRKLSPDLILIDIALPGKSGLELIKDLKALHTKVAVLAISMHDELLYAERMLRAGARGYITKQQPPEELVKAIHQVLANHVYVSREVSQILLGRFSGNPASDRSGIDILTDREFEVLRLIGEGKAPKEIARQLHLSTKTVAVHNANIRQKLKVKSTAQLIRFAVQSEILQRPNNG